MGTGQFDATVRFLAAHFCPVWQPTYYTLQYELLPNWTQPLISSAQPPYSSLQLLLTPAVLAPNNPALASFSKLIFVSNQL